jgi:hypothetical protein
VYYCSQEAASISSIEFAEVPEGLIQGWLKKERKKERERGRKERERERKIL